MAISVKSPQARVGFIRNATSANASATETILAGVAGKRIMLKHVTMSNRTAGALSFTLHGVAALLGPISIGANSSIQWDFFQPMILAVGQALEIEADSGNIMIFCQGTIE